MGWHTPFTPFMSRHILVDHAQLGAEVALVVVPQWCSCHHRHPCFQLCEVLVKLKKFDDLMDMACAGLIYQPFLNSTEMIEASRSFLLTLTAGLFERVSGGVVVGHPLSEQT